MGWREHRQLARRERRRRAAARVVHPVPELERRRAVPQAPASALRTAGSLGASSLLHLGVFGSLSASAHVSLPAPREDIQIVMVAAPPPPPPPAVEEPAPDPEPEPEPEPIPEPDPEPEPEVEVAPSPEPAEPPRRVVGLSQDSAVEGGSGPRYAIGNTQLGRTASVAADPQAVPHQAPPPNRRAQLPTLGKGKLKKPRRLGSVELVYPADLEAQGIEADVPVEVDLDAAGAVVAVRILKAPAHPAFAAAARAAAQAQRFKPATQAGRPVPYTLSYTYRFRITS